MGVFVRVCKYDGNIQLRVMGKLLTGLGSVIRSPRLSIRFSLGFPYLHPANCLALGLKNQKPKQVSLCLS